MFEGGFLGLDNIGVFNRSEPLPSGEFIEQADGTGWMAMYSLNLLAIALELARVESAYEDVASKFWEHFLYIASAINNLGDDGMSMWNEEDGFFYDVMHLPDGSHVPLRMRSMVGLIPLFAVETLEARLVDQLPGFKRRMQWFIDNRPDLTHNVASMSIPGKGERRLLSMVNPEQLRRILKRCSIRRVSFGVRDPQPLAGASRPSVRAGIGRTGTRGGIRARGIGQRAVRRQFELARAGVVSVELPAHRIAAEVSSLSGRRLQGGVPYRVGPDA